MSGVIGAITGSNKQAKAAQQAANQQYEATKYASDQQREMFDELRKDQQPYMQAGSDALKQLMGGMGADGRFMQTFNGQDIYNDPSYKFRLNQGLDAVQSGAAAQGGLLSGATQKALNNYAQDFASQEYQNAYNRFNADQTNQYNRLSNLVGLGQSAAAGVGNAGMQTSQAIANNTMAGANAQAAGTIAAGNKNANNFQTLLGLANTAAKFYTGGMI
ncbi:MULTISPECIES: DNA transfer protein p32 [Acinetobacter]|uniref:DNA transfer protein p32 n=1 Tax=Acinetobacter TaxID=469 RepID=UPI001CA7AACE|nr:MULTISPECIES: DNA transfer protein p32 [Acinetobacter]MBY8898518.1 DNA transfer protein p32 [Acinetobacter baumannii]MBY8907386.1 DNA transfer protein p32 [Acinetobacter baumannii]MCZ3306447.1 DNA transfer protein p32 [Acinetobacter baumannii]MDA3588232.1 DNA transfer protein p32 [Acinetobacter sp. AOR01_HL]